MSTACTELTNWNLFVTKAKTDNMHIFLMNTSKTDDAGGMLRGNEQDLGISTLQHQRREDSMHTRQHRILEDVDAWPQNTTGQMNAGVQYDGHPSYAVQLCSMH